MRTRFDVREHGDRTRANSDRVCHPATTQGAAFRSPERGSPVFVGDGPGAISQLRLRDLTQSSPQVRRILQFQELANTSPRILQRNDIEMEVMDIAARLRVRGYRIVDGPTEDFVRIDGTHTLLYAPKLKSTDQGLADDLIGSLQHGTVVYRGLGRWHPHWHEARNRGEAIPLGSGPPHFDTSDSRWVPFTTLDSVAHLAARSKSGMGKGDNVEFVEGYSKDPGWETGLVLKYNAPARSALCFFNASEVQVQGPVNATIDAVYRMGTEIAKDTTIGDVYPDPPSEEEKRTYVKEHGRLRHGK